MDLDEIEIMRQLMFYFGNIWVPEENVPPSISLFLGGRFEEVLQHDSSKQIIGQNPGNNKYLDGAIVHNVQSYLTTEAGDDTSLR